MTIPHVYNSSMTAVSHAIDILACSDLKQVDVVWTKSFHTIHNVFKLYIGKNNTLLKDDKIVSLRLTNTLNIEPKNAYSMGVAVLTAWYIFFFI